MNQVFSEKVFSIRLFCRNYFMQIFISEILECQVFYFGVFSFFLISNFQKSDLFCDFFSFYFLSQVVSCNTFNVQLLPTGFSNKASNVGFLVTNFLTPEFSPSFFLPLKFCHLNFQPMIFFCQNFQEIIHGLHFYIVGTFMLNLSLVTILFSLKISLPNCLP